MRQTRSPRSWFPVARLPLADSAFYSRRSEIHLADGLFGPWGEFRPLPDAPLKPLEEMFRARVIGFLLQRGLLPEERARMLLGWRHSGFSVHRGRVVEAGDGEGLEKLARYILRNPFSVAKMRLTGPDGTVFYQSRMNPKAEAIADFRWKTAE